MKINSSTIGFLATLAIEAAGILSSARAVPLLGFSPRWQLVLSHLFACWIFTLTIQKSFPKSYQQHRVMALLLVFGFSLCLPIIGPLTVYLLINIIQSPVDSEESVDQFIFGFGDDTSVDVNISSDIQGSQSAAEVMGQRDPQARRLAILSMRHVAPIDAIPLLRRGLQDSDEEVRIFAQRILSGFVEEHETSIKAAEKEIAAGSKSIQDHLTLAELYHEMVYLDLITDREVKSYYMDKSIKLIQDARELSPQNTEILFLLLKYSILTHKIDVAQECLDELKLVGFPQRLLAPWDIELQFIQRKWHAFKDGLTTASIDSMGETKLKYLSKFWLTTGVDATHAR